MYIEHDQPSLSPSTAPMLKIILDLAEAREIVVLVARESPQLIELRIMNIYCLGGVRDD